MAIFFSFEDCRNLNETQTYTYKTDTRPKNTKIYTHTHTYTDKQNHFVHNQYAYKACLHLYFVEAKYIHVNVHHTSVHTLTQWKNNFTKRREKKNKV